MNEIDILRIKTLLNHIDTVLSDTKDISASELFKNDLLLRATSFSIVQIGEMMIQLQRHLNDEYPDLPWAQARRMRNIIVHDYGNIDIELVYDTIRNDLPVLKNELIKIQNKFSSNS